MSKRFKTAFTLVELLVVIAIVGILSGLIIVGMSSSVYNANIAKAQVFSSSLRDSLLMNLTNEWKFDGTASDGALATTDDIKDTWGNDNGILCTTGGGAPTVRTGSKCISGSCLEFDNVDDQFYVNDPTLRYVGNGMTLEAWIKVRSTSDGTVGHVISKPWNGGGFYNYRIYWLSNTIYFILGGDTGQSKTVTASNILKDKWYNIVASVNPDSSDKMVKLYVNGVLAVTPSAHTITTWIPTSGGGDASIQLSIGHQYRCDTSVPQSLFDGYIDNVRIFNAEIPASQIREHYYSGLARLVSSNSIDHYDYRERLKQLIDN